MPNLTAPAQARHRRAIASPAALALAAAGAYQDEVAAAYGCTPPYVSNVLNGRRPIPEEFHAVLAGLVGDDAAKCVLAAIPPTGKRAARRRT
jgi:hypothetical protein